MNGTDKSRREEGLHYSAAGSQCARLSGSTYSFNLSTHHTCLHIVCVYFIYLLLFYLFIFCLFKPGFHAIHCQLPSLCFPHLESLGHDQLSSSSFHLIITSLVDKDAHKSGELFGSGQIELFVTSWLKDISQIQTLTDFMCRTTLTHRKSFPSLFWFEVEKVIEMKKYIWVDGWIKGLTALA